MKLIVNNTDRVSRGKKRRANSAEKRKRIIRILALFGALIMILTFIISLFF